MENALFLWSLEPQGTDKQSGNGRYLYELVGDHVAYTPRLVVGRLTQRRQNQLLLVGGVQQHRDACTVLFSQQPYRVLLTSTDVTSTQQPSSDRLTAVSKAHVFVRVHTLLEENKSKSFPVQF